MDTISAMDTVNTMNAINTINAMDHHGMQVMHQNIIITHHNPHHHRVLDDQVSGVEIQIEHEQDQNAEVNCETKVIENVVQEQTQPEDQKAQKSKKDPNRPRRKHVVLTIAQKQEVVQAVLSGAKPAEVCQKFNLARSTLFDLVKRKQRLLVFGTDGKINNDMGNRKTMHGARHRKLDYALLKWYTKRTNEGYTVTGPMIKEKAKQFHQELGIATVCKFTAGWLDKFKHRHGLKFSKAKKEKVTLSHDAETIHHFIDDYEDFKEEFMTDIEKTMMIDIKQEHADDDRDGAPADASNNDDLTKVVNTPTHGKIMIKSSRKQMTRLKSAIRTLMRRETECEMFGKHVATQLKTLPPDLAAAAKSSIQEYITQVKVQECSGFPASHYVYIDQQGAEGIHQAEIVHEALESPAGAMTTQEIDVGTITYQTVDLRNGQTIQQTHAPVGRVIKHIEIQTQPSDDRLHPKIVAIDADGAQPQKNYQLEIRGDQVVNVHSDVRIHNVEIPAAQMNIESLQSVIRNNLLDINGGHATNQPNLSANNILDIRNVYMELQKRF